MNSAALTTSLYHFPETSQWDEVRRIYRRVCVLRVMGKVEEAAELEHTELAHVLSTARIAGNQAEDESALLAVEADRVANACVLAELLAPLLAEHLRTDARPPASALQRAPIPASTEVMKPAPVLRSPPPAIPSITDLIDGMLSQELSAPTRPARP